MGGTALVTTFYGVEVAPSKPRSLELTNESSIHVSMATLGLNPKDGRTVLFAEVDGAKHVLCALTTVTHEMAPLDLMFGLPQKVKLSVSGKNSIHISGYQIVDDDDFGDDFDGPEGMDPDDDEEDEEDEEDEIMPAKRASPAMKAKASAKGQPVVEEDDELDDLEDDEEGFPMEEGDEEDDEEDDEEEPQLPIKKSPKASPKPSPRMQMKVPSFGQDEEDEEDDEEDDEDFAALLAAEDDED